MKSFLFFDLYDYLIVGFLFLLAVAFSYFFIKRFNKKRSQIQYPGLVKLGFVNLIPGLFLVILAIIWFLYLEKGHDKIIAILQSVSIMTSKPFVLLTIAVLLFGLAFIFIGINFIIKNKTVKPMTTSGSPST